MILAGCADGSLAEPAAGRIDRDGGVAALVCVDPTITMVVSPFFSWGDNDRPGGHLSVGAMPRSYQATPVPVDHVTNRTTGRSHEGQDVVERAGNASRS